MATVKRPRTKKNTEPKETLTPAKASVNREAATETRTVDVQQAIRLRAYELFVQRGYQHGADLEDWLRAEQEYGKRFSATAA